MVVWGGGFFYLSDRTMERLYDIPKGRVMISHALPGSPFSGVFYPMHPEDSRFLNVIESIEGHPIRSLQDLRDLIPPLSSHKYIELQYRNYGFYVVSGEYLSISRHPKTAGVNFLASTTIPEVLQLKGTEWVSQPIDVTSQGKAKTR
jgi:hypothetical protein